MVLGIPRWLLLAIYLPAVAIVVAMAIGSVYTQTPIDALTRDPNAVGGVHPLTGMLSNLGILVWCSAAAVCLFGATALPRSGRSETSRFLVSSGLLTFLLLLDDLFQFHELLAERYLGLSERVIFAAYALLIVVYSIVFRAAILRTVWTPLLLALVFFAFSLTTDQFERWLWRLGRWSYYVDDAFKFLGIASWCGYFMHATFQLLFGGLAQPERGEAPGSS